jgi:hypothetical protein
MASSARRGAEQVTPEAEPGVQLRVDLVAPAAPEALGQAIDQGEKVECRAVQEAEHRAEGGAAFVEESRLPRCRDGPPRPPARQRREGPRFGRGDAMVALQRRRQFFARHRAGFDDLAARPDCR